MDVAATSLPGVNFDTLIYRSQNSKKIIIVGTIYKPPDTSTVDFNMHVNGLLRTISQERKNV